MDLYIFLHLYYGKVLGFSFVTELAKKLYKISHTLSVGALFLICNALRL